MVAFAHGRGFQVPEPSNVIHPFESAVSRLLQDDPAFEAEIARDLEAEAESLINRYEAAMLALLVTVESAANLGAVMFTQEHEAGMRASTLRSSAELHEWIGSVRKKSRAVRNANPRLANIMIRIAKIGERTAEKFNAVNRRVIDRISKLSQIAKTDDTGKKRLDRTLQIYSDAIRQAFGYVLMKDLEYVTQDGEVYPKVTYLVSNGLYRDPEAIVDLEAKAHDHVAKVDPSLVGSIALAYEPLADAT